MGEKPTIPHSSPLVPVPVPAKHTYKRPPMPELPWWTLCVRWLQYHTIQIRWDIERWLARRLHRRWGSK